MRTNLSLMSVDSGVSVHAENTKAGRNPQISEKIILQMLLLQQPLDFFFFHLDFPTSNNWSSENSPPCAQGQATKGSGKRKVLAGPLYPSSLRSEPLGEAGELVVAADTDGVCNPFSAHTTCRHVNSPRQTVLAGILSRCNREHLLVLIYLRWPAARPAGEITQEIPKHTYLDLYTYIKPYTPLNVPLSFPLKSMCTTIWLVLLGT